MENWKKLGNGFVERERVLRGGGGGGGGGGNRLPHVVIYFYIKG